MSPRKSIHTARYVVLDFITAALAWSVLFFYRKHREGVPCNDMFSVVFADPKYIISVVLIPFLWVCFYFFFGFYRRIFFRSRLKELGQTAAQTIIGAVVIFFVLILDDEVIDVNNYYHSFFVLVFAHFILTYFARLIITSYSAKKIHKGIWGFNTIIVGNNGNALRIYEEIIGQVQKTGNHFIGYVPIFENFNDSLSKYLHKLGTLSELEDIINKQKIEDVIIAVESTEHQIITDILSSIDNTSATIKIIPDYKDILAGNVKMNSIFHTPLITVSREPLPYWQKTLKRSIDIFTSLFVLIVLSPVYLITALIVKLSSKGPVIYSQERVGLYGKPFVMHKFRSMYVNAESNGPALSSKNDNRITSFGKFMRKYRLDELPQFYNVLIGNMSIVGPRPERKFYMDQIIQKAPYQKLLLKIKPGLTGWGQVKYGYAENIDQMVERLKYDILYLENISLAMDFKILIYTALIVIQGRGK